MEEKKITAISSFLKSTNIFREVPLPVLEEAAGHCRISNHKRGTILYRKGDPASLMFFLQRGYIMEQVYYRESVDIIIKVKCPGDYFGETAVMTDMEYLNTALVTEDSSLVVMPKAVFLQLAWTNHTICQVVIRELVERLTNSAQNMVNSMYLDAPGRLAFTLLNLMPGAGQSRNAELRVTQSSLAASAGMARQTAAAILGDWRKAGWITTDRGKLSVLDLDCLLDIIMNSELRC